MLQLARINKLLSFRNLALQAQKNVRLISTSEKKRETVAVDVNPPKVESAAVSTNKNWVSYGFDRRDEKNDISASHASFFFSVTLCLVWGTLVWAYLPDTQLRDWSQREGYLELRRREAAGVELISPDYIDRSTIVLPSDEELGDTEIII